MLTIKTLGEFDVLLNGTSLLAGTDFKRGLFLIYLWEQQKSQPRPVVARLLWPRTDESTALVNLRSLLLRLRREGVEPYLNSGRTTVALANREKIDYDVARLRAATTNLQKAQLPELMAAADLYRGAFLANAILDDYEELDEWASALRAEMEIRIVQVLSTLVSTAIQSGHARMVLAYAEHLVTLTPYEDESQELYMQALVALGRVSDALNHFHQYRRRLQKELQADTGPNLNELVTRLKRPNLDLAAINAYALAVDTPKSPTVPAVEERVARFPFIEHLIIGRQNETQQLFETLDAGSRLVTITGIGGIGKTFFVRSQYDLLEQRFGAAVYYTNLRNEVSLQTQASDALLLAIANSLNCTLQAHLPVFDQVAERLARQKCCLILDNFETVQASTPCVEALLKSASELTIIVTSRERLELHAEFFLPLEGLSQTADMPTEAYLNGQASNHADHRYDSEAARYFKYCLQRYDIGFHIDPEVNFWIDRICGEVEGLPLAIELAAMQIPFYSLEELASLIAEDSTVLSSEFGDMPGDHYSVWAVLDNMWETLSETERRVLAELSVFAGVFHREAMAAVAPAVRSVYSRLINTSLLRTEDPAWFSLHLLVKQHASRRLTSDTPHERHARYFLGMFDNELRIHEELATQQLAIPPLVIRYQSDIASAWDWAVNHGAWDLLEQAQLGFTLYLLCTHQLEKLLRLTSQLMDKLPAPKDRTRSQHRLAGRAAYRLAVLQPVDSMALWFERSLESLTRADDPWDIAAAALGYAEKMLSCGVGDRAQIEPLLTLARDLIEKHQLEPLRIALDLAVCSHLLHQGQWANLRERHTAILERMARPTILSAISHNMRFSAFLDNWQLLAQLVVRTEVDNNGTVALPEAKQWAAHYWANAMAQSEQIEAAIQQRKSVLGDYAKVNTQFMLPMVYGELALWHYTVGDLVAAHDAAQEALACASQKLNRLAAGFGELFVAAFYYHTGNATKAFPQLYSALMCGRQLHHTTMVFSAIYYLARIYADKLPGDLVQRILKIGAVSPAMHFSLRPFARRHLQLERIEIADDECTSLWATNEDDVKRLLTQMEPYLDPPGS